MSIPTFDQLTQHLSGRARARLKRRIRSDAMESGSNSPVVVVEGGSPPKVRGRSYYHTNASGDLIRHPNAYRRAYGKPIYVPSSRRIEVGERWVSALLQLKEGTPTGVVNDYLADIESGEIVPGNVATITLGN